MTEIIKNAELPYRYDGQPRYEARKKGEKIYFNGESCKKGHFCPRYVSNKKCVECDKLRRINENGKYAKIKKKYWLKTTYGLTTERYNELLWLQNYLCGLCQNQLDLKKKTHIDHIKGTKIIRGILCHQCNVGIGFFKHNPTLLRKAALYCEAE